VRGWRGGGAGTQGCESGGCSTAQHTEGQGRTGQGSTGHFIVLHGKVQELLLHTSFIIAQSEAGGGAGAGAHLGSCVTARTIRARASAAAFFAEGASSGLWRMARRAFLLLLRGLRAPHTDGTSAVRIQGLLSAHPWVSPTCLTTCLPGSSRFLGVLFVSCSALRPAESTHLWPSLVGSKAHQVLECLRQEGHAGGLSEVHEEEVREGLQLVLRCAGQGAGGQG